MLKWLRALVRRLFAPAKPKGVFSGRSCTLNSCGKSYQAKGWTLYTRPLPPPPGVEELPPR